MSPSSNSRLFTYSLANALYKADNISSYLISRHKLNLDNDWVTTSNLVSCLLEIGEKVGESTLRRVGKNIAIFSRPQIKLGSTFNEFFECHLNELYLINHKKLNNGFGIKKTPKGYIINLKNNPYPIAFNMGLVSGFCLINKTVCTVEELEEQVLQVNKII